MEAKEIGRLEAHLRDRINPGIEARKRPRDAESLELYLKGEFIGLCYRDQDEGELSYHLTMTILAEDIA